MKRLIFILMISAISSVSFSQKENRFIRDGNRKFREGEFTEAEVDYRKAMDINARSLSGEFNLGDAMYMQKNYEESGKVFNTVTEKYADPGLRAEAFHNLGNSLLENKKYGESIEAYKNALRLNPEDNDTRYNLAYAKEMLKKQQQQQQQQGKDNKDQQKEKQEQKDQQQKNQQQDQQQKDQQDQKNREQKDQQQQNQKDQGVKKDQGQQHQQAQPRQISKEDAERMLQAMKNDEKKTLEKLMKLKAKNASSLKSEKDW